MVRELLSSFNGKANVTKITNDNGAVSYLTQSISYADEKMRTGAQLFNTVENTKKHVFFFLSREGAELGRYYLCQKLQGLTPSQLAQRKHTLCFFEHFNPETKAWVPCVGESSQKPLTEGAMEA